MARRIVMLVLSTITLLALAESPARARPPSATDEQVAKMDALVERGNQALREGQPDEAVRLFREAHEVAPSVLQPLRLEAQVLSTTGRCREALPILDKLIARYQDPEHPDNSAATRDTLKKKRAEIEERTLPELAHDRESCLIALIEKPTLRVVTTPPGAEVRVDAVTGPVLGRTPFETRAVPAGEHDVIVTLAGYRAETRHVELHPGAVLEQTVNLTADAPPTPPPVEKPTPPPPPAPAPPPPPPPEACPAGQVHVEGTTRCCWPGQVWGGERCRGLPSDCPRYYHVDAAAEACALDECADGKERASNGLDCCWRGQVFVGGVCRGRPSRCPWGLDLVGEECSAEARNRADAEAAARKAASRQEFDAADEKVNHWLAVGSYGLIGSIQVISSRAMYKDNSAQFAQSLTADVRRAINFAYLDGGDPLVGIDLALSAGLAIGYGNATVLHGPLRADVGVRLWYFVPHFSVALDWFHVPLSDPNALGPSTSVDETPLSAGPGLAFGSYGTTRGDSRAWLIALHWLPFLDGGGDNYSAEAKIAGSLLCFGATLRHFTTLGTLRDGWSAFFTMGLGKAF